jgi:hypothetical protein
MDPELTLQFDRALEGLQEQGIRVSPAATVLLLVSLASVQDDLDQRYKIEVRRNVQQNVIARLQRSITVVSRHYGTSRVDALMVLQFMPRIMSEFCPPFENPPPY